MSSVDFASPRGVERRAKKRFVLDREARYRLLYGQHLAESGQARALNMSSSGLWIATEEHLEPGLPIEVSISWPALLNETCQLQLIVFGCIIRSTDGGAAVNVERYEFRTMASRSFNASA